MEKTKEMRNKSEERQKGRGEKVKKEKVEKVSHSQSRSWPGSKPTVPEWEAIAH